MTELPFAHVVVPGDLAADARRDQLGTPGFVPVVLGAPENLQRLLDDLAFLREDPTAILRRAAEVDAAEWYEARHADDPDLFAIEEGEWPDTPVPEHRLRAIRQPDGEELLPEVVIGMVPASAPWDVPAALGFGGWNRCPQIHEHVALFRRWHEHFGAAVSAVVGNTVELEVTKPPLDPEAAELLAMEHILYCPELIRTDEGEDRTLADLASALMFGSVWSFTWS